LKYQCGAASKETTLQLNGRLIAEVTLQPAALIVFADKIGEHDLVLTDSRSKALEVLDVQSSSAKLVARIGEPTQDAQGTHRKITLAVAEDYPDGRHEETVDIYTDDSRYADIRVPVTLVKHAQQRLSATPNEVELVAAAGQPFPSRIVLIRDELGQRVHIDRIVVDDPALSCQWAPGPNLMVTLRIRVDRNRISGEALRSAVHVQIDQPVALTLTIPISCTVH
jgi:hypothetical protein